MTWQDRQWCGELRESLVAQSVVLYGWVDAVRDHGHLLFIHLRDISGMVQVVFGPELPFYALARQLRSEFVIELKGTLKRRDPGTNNPHLATGTLEVIASELTVLNKANTPPFEISEHGFSGEESVFKVEEETRLRYRYLDLRRPSMQQHLIQRSTLLKKVRDYLHDRRFIEVETPMLTKSTPEGARDYLVPSRVHPGSFYALPQSPQLFKQLLMMSSLDRYFQIVKCFRDEDLRPNRQPEFTQVDLEASFIDETFIYDLLEGLLVQLFAHVGVTLPRPFPTITYDESMRLYGNDRPDLRFGWTMVDVTSVFSQTGYKIFQQISTGGGLIKGLNLTGQSPNLSKNVLQEELAKGLIPKLGGKGMTWMRVENGQLESNIVQFFSEAEKSSIMSLMNAKDGDVLVFVADFDSALVNQVLGQFRVIMGERLGQIDEKAFAPCWVVDFPMFEKGDGRLTSVHHPFTQPQSEIKGLSEAELLKVKARAYDVVVNGEELGGGSIRIHSPQMQEDVFKILGFTSDQIEAQFGFFVKALQYGTPPHGGLALGVDRLVSMLLGVDSIREVMAFPKNRMAFCPLTQSPSGVSQAQLDDLGLVVKVPVDLD